MWTEAENFFLRFQVPIQKLIQVEPRKNERAFRADAGHFGESKSIFEKCPNFIRSKDTGCFMHFIKTFNWYNSWTSTWILTNLSNNESRSTQILIHNDLGPDRENHILCSTSHKTPCISNFLKVKIFSESTINKNFYRNNGTLPINFSWSIEYLEFSTQRAQLR